MTVDRDALYNLLPALYRQRDEERGGPLRQLLEVLTDELAVVADGVDQLYDDLFVETAAPWVLPYLAELIGLRGLPSGFCDGSDPPCRGGEYHRLPPAQGHRRGARTAHPRRDRLAGASRRVLRVDRRHPERQPRPTGATWPSRRSATPAG